MEIQYPLDNLIPEIVSDSNMYSGYDYVISHLESKEQRAKYAPDKEPKTEYDFNTPEEYTAYLKQQIYAAKVRDAIIGTLKRQIADGTFRITLKDVKTLRVKDGCTGCTILLRMILRRCRDCLPTTIKMTFPIITTA